VKLSPRTMVFIASTNSTRVASFAGFLPITRIELSPRPTAMSMRPPLMRLRVAKMLAATDQSRTLGLVTSGP
jgi:hypothetical protein